MRVQILVDGLQLASEEIGAPTGKLSAMGGQLGFWLVQAAKTIKGYSVPRNMAAMTVSFESTEK